MHIQCPSCHARTKLSPGEAEGARVRCSECGRVFPARAIGDDRRAVGRRRWLGVLLAAAALAAGWVALRSASDRPAAAAGASRASAPTTEAR